ncbi:MAG TPA: SNF2-related protein [Thermoanaerobaculia bacterium]|jgi:adenine-specific DNA-methyltransferase|nr:SNF2-related protein [Thermoanaerobaculia bacterium]
MKTPYHSTYWAHALTLQGARGSIETLSRSLAGARVDLNPHQVDAALFAMQSPFTRGVILADEVGLGKTIEAGLVIAQRWAERKRRILLVLPATLRKQWQQEMQDKFLIPTMILEAGSYTPAKKAGSANPFDQKDRVVVCSYQFVVAKAADVRAVSWDLVVIDEAHRLRNIYKPGNKIATGIVNAVGGAPTVLLTATPLQNSLLELYGLVSVVDKHVFGDVGSFRGQFIKDNDEIARNEELKRRLLPLCRRTLRKQVKEYIRFTERVPITQEFLPSEAEHRLYEKVSAYLQRGVLHALPASQRQLMTLVLRKLLASSSFAIAGTLRSLVRRLEKLEREKAPQTTLPLDVEDFEALPELQEEWNDDRDEAKEEPTDLPSLKEELAELRRYADLAETIHHNAKADALLAALGEAFTRAASIGAPRKAVIFTESRRTQDYLARFLADHGYAAGIVLINGSNADPQSKAVYEAWMEKHEGTEAISGSRSADMKAALVEEFKDRATLLIATESAAEGVNLQFASLVVNYDLPWNPQRIEQRIGRCHRYGQKHDVVVVNFLNKRNAADQRVYQLLDEKFKLFSGVFGASDEVLGALESGVDLEKRIAKVYQECRSAEEIQCAFDALQAELDAQVSSRMTEARNTLLEHFDQEVHQRLRMHGDETKRALSLHERWLLDLTRQELGADAEFDADLPRFRYMGSLAHAGNYNLDWKDAENRDEPFYRLDHPLAQKVLASALTRPLSPTSVSFTYAPKAGRISAIEPFLGKTGYLELAKVTVASVETDEALVFSACLDDGTEIDNELCGMLLSLDGTVGGAVEAAPDSLSPIREIRVKEVVAEVEHRNARHFDEEVLKLDRWAEDLKFGLEKEIKDLDRDMKEIRRTAALAQALAEKLEAQKALKGLDEKRKKKRRDLFDAHDAIDQRRDDLIKEIEKQLEQRVSAQPLFLIRWSLA